MFTARLAPVAYQDPWTATFAERKATLLSGDPRIAYYYARPDTSTFRYRAFNMRLSGNSTAKKAGMAMR